MPSSTKLKTKKHNKSLLISSSVFSLLLVATLVSGLVLSGTRTHADDTTQSDNVTVTVSSACTLSRSAGSGTYSATLNPGQETGDISGSTIKAICNDGNGYSLYAIGYSGDSYTGNNTKMIGTYGNIDTGTSGDNSWWAMKLAPVAGTYAPTIVNSFDNYHVVPATFTQVAKLTSATDAGESATGSSVDAFYKVKASTSQVAGTYTGKVKYTLVHPNAAIPQTKYYMQDFTIGMCEVLANSSPITVYDRRDETPYKVQYLPDGNCWMLDNLALDPTAVSLSDLQGKTNASSQTLTYLKNGGGTTSDQYATAGVANWTSGYSYSAPLINATDKNNTTTSYGAGSGKIGVYYNYCAASAGSYCYGNGTSAGTSSGDATEDICPAGWRLPTGGGDETATNNEFNNLALELGLTFDEDWKGYTGTTYQTALSTPLSGYFVDGSAVDQGTDGDFWSSTRLNNRSMYRLYVDADGAGPTFRSGRLRGGSVRCLASS